jgi:hypothetical protein
MRRIITSLLITLGITGCTTVKYNGAETNVRQVDYPNHGEIVTAYVGDKLLAKGKITEAKVLEVRQTVNGICYDIPAGSYKQIGFDKRKEFYSAGMVVKAALCDPFKALLLEKKPDAEICVVTVFGALACYKGEYERKSQPSEIGESFQQTLIYNGRIGDKINVGYREFSNSLARPAFNNDVEYDLSASRTIGYKGAQIEVIDANNNSITYRVLRTFP